MFDVRPCADQEEYSRAIGAIGQYFNPPPSEEFLERSCARCRTSGCTPPARTAQIVGGAGAFPFELSVPGGSLPCAGVTAVGVHPTHRRRGVLRSMMDAQLRDVHERGEPIAALWASEETIYGRFGYGLASWAGELNVHARVGRVRGAARVGRDDAVRHARGGAASCSRRSTRQVRRERPGMMSRSGQWWDDPAPAPRRGRERTRRAASSCSRSTASRRATRSTGRTSPSRAVCPGRGSSCARRSARHRRLPRRLWRYLLDVDWMSVVEVPFAPPDHPLFLLLGLPRRARYRMHDALWVRLVDLPAALSGRTYGEGGPLVLEVRDADLRLERRALAARRRHVRAAPTPRPTSRSTSRRSARRTSAPCRSRSSATSRASRS